MIWFLTAIAWQKCLQKPSDQYSFAVCHHPLFSFSCSISTFLCSIEHALLIAPSQFLSVLFWILFCCFPNLIQQRILEKKKKKKPKQIYILPMGISFIFLRFEVRLLLLFVIFLFLPKYLHLFPVPTYLNSIYTINVTLWCMKDKKLPWCFNLWSTKVVFQPKSTVQAMYQPHVLGTLFQSWVSAERQLQSLLLTLDYSLSC